MAINKLNSNLNIISNLPDKPTQEVSTLKAKFDEAGNTIKDYINTILIPSIENGEIPLINNLTSGGTKSALTAEMGKELNTKKQNAIRYGTTVPTLSDGEIFIQIFDEE
nr:MAG TPA: hypothetical protein [Caudoviricetes sp.]